MKDVTVTLKLDLTTTGATREDILRHALEVITNSYNECGLAVLKDSMTVEEQ